jgi:hypothetical protein
MAAVPVPVPVPVTRGGRGLLRKRASLAAARLAEAQWRAQWQAATAPATGAIRYDISFSPASGRWHVDGSWMVP